MPLGLYQLPPALIGAVSVLAFTALALLVGLLLALWRGSRLKSRLAELRGELESLRSKPSRHEFRIEQYDILWYPVLTLNESTKKILKATAGFPFCRKCAVRLTETAGGKGWGCPKCDFRCAASVIDVAVTDSVNQRAVEYYRQRHPGFELETAAS